MLLQIQPDESLISYVIRAIHINQYSPKRSLLDDLTPRSSFDTEQLRKIAGLNGWPGCYLPEGGLLCAKEFLHLGSRAAVDQALSRLARDGQLIRATRGLYLAAITDQGKYVAPAMDKVVSALASKNQEEIALDGARSAKMLGLAVQVPSGDAFLTNGRARTLQVGEVTAEIRHAPHWMLALGSTTAGAVIRALAWLGERRIGEVMEALRKQLTPIDWHALSSVRSLLPSWMALAIGREVG